MARDAGIRAFWGVALSEAARRRAAAVAAALRAEPGGDAVRWVREESLHVTLRFLGRTDPADLPRLVREVGAAVREIPLFSLRLAGVQLLPSPRRPRVVALGLEPVEPLAALASAVERGTVAAGLPAEARPFRAHVTLGRAQRDRRVRLGPLSTPDVGAGVTESVMSPGDAWDVTEAVLFRSDLAPEGARYTPLERVPLGAHGGKLHP